MESMTNWLPRLTGLVRAEILSAEPELLLNRCGRAGLPLRQIRRTGDFGVEIELPERDLPALRDLAAGCGGEIRVLELRGGSRSRRLLRSRSALLLSLLLAGCLLLASSLFIWEIRVVGCERLSSGQVLRSLADAGVESGAFWPGIDPDLVRSRVLSELPELQWMTVNISGSRATVLVREREVLPPDLGEQGPADVVAACDGVIRSTAVLRGHGLVQPGDAVLAGEVLVSGTVESITAPPRFVRAMAEIQAETWHEKTAVCPLEMPEQQEKKTGIGRFALQIGKKRLYFGPSGGKGLDGCGKIVHEYTLGVEGLFALPLRLLRETPLSAQTADAAYDREEEMKAALLHGLEAEIDGEILDADFVVARQDGLLLVTLRARCSENIACTAERAP